MQNFPQELIDLVIDHLPLTAFKTIEACCLVSRRWLPRARFRIYSDVDQVFFGGDSLRAWLARIDSSPEILSLVSRIQLDFVNPPFDEGDLTQLRHCTNLDSLSLEAAKKGATVLLAQFHAFIQTDLPQITSLSYFQVLSHDDISLRTIIDVLSCLPALETFRIGGWGASILPATPHLSVSLPQRLHTLEIILGYGCNTSPFFAWLMSLPVVPKMKSLTFEAHIEEVDGPEMAYVQHTGSELEFLKLEVSSATRLVTEVFHRGVLQHSINIRHLETYLDEDSQVPVFLSMIQSPGLETIHIVVAFPWDTEVPAVSISVSWGLIDQALAHPRFSALQWFSFERDDGPNSDAFSLLTLETMLQMPLAHARGILH
ncbi:hypothetical protein C8R43DRAFT_994894 [Mycena crocata]|nr:hypothetical protein C8R43DRAFT_994894 [Mycena crocata]